MEEKKLAKSQVTFIRQTARKVRRTANLVRNMRAEQALVQLSFQPFKSVEPLIKLIKNAMANAEHNLNIENPGSLRISELLVDDATMYKRWRAMNKGRAYSIMKRNSKLKLVLSEMTAAEYAKYVWDKSARNKKNHKKAEAISN